MEQTAAFLLRYDAGEDPEEAFAQSFGIDTRDMDKELLKYSDDNTFNTIVFPELQYDGEIARRAVEPGEIEYLTGDIAIEMGRVGVVHYVFDEIGELPADSLFADRIKATRAIAYIHEDRVEEGDVVVAELVAGGFDDVETLTSMTHYEYDRALFAERAGDGGVDTHLALAIAYGNRATALEPANTAARYYLALAHEENGDIPSASEAMLGVFSANGSNRIVALNLARLLIKQGQISEGSYLLSRAYSASHTEDDREALREIQLTVEADDFDIATIDALMGTQ